MNYTAPKTQNFGLFFALAAFVLSSLFSLSLQAQAEEKKAQEKETYTYAIVNYMKARPGQNPVELEMEVWKPIHQQLIKSGKRVGWDVYGVAFPSGTEAEYDYITVDYFRGMENMELTGADMEKAFNAAHPGKKWEDFDDKTTKARDMARSEVYVWRGSTSGGQEDETPRVINVHKMKVAPTKHQEYREMEMEIAKPLHQASVDAGMMSGWNFWQKIFPGGTSQEYNYVTGEVYTSMKAMENDKTSDGGKIFQKVHPDKDMDETVAYIMGLRDEASSELWMIVESVRAPAATTSADE